jgi:hypothetical protein
MKKIILILTLISFAVIGHAQWFIGGNVGYNHNSEEQEASSNNSEEKIISEFSFSPMFGYQADRFAIGTSLSFVQNTITDKRTYWLSVWVPPTVEERIFHDERIAKITLWGIQPFLRYTLVEYGKFSVFANAELHLLTGKNEETNNHKGPFSNTTHKERFNVRTAGVNFTPVLVYNLSERINLEATLNFMNLGWNWTRIAHDRNIEQKTISINYGFGLNSGNVVDVGAISIGFIYKFREPSDEVKQIRQQRREERRQEPIRTVPGLDAQPPSNNRHWSGYGI